MDQKIATVAPPSVEPEVEEFLVQIPDPNERRRGDPLPPRIHRLIIGETSVMLSITSIAAEEAATMTLQQLNDAYLALPSPMCIKIDKAKPGHFSFIMFPVSVTLEAVEMSFVEAVCNTFGGLARFDFLLAVLWSIAGAAWKPWRRLARKRKILLHRGTWCAPTVRPDDG